MAKDYLTRFSRHARWYLPPEEAAEVIADYRELLSGDPRPEEDELGAPEQAVRLLIRPRETRRWLAVFVLLACLALVVPLGGLYGFPFHFGILTTIPVLETIWEWYEDAFSLLSAGIPLLGTVLALVWFGKNGPKEAGGPPFRRMLPMLAAAVLTILLALGVFWLMVSLDSGQLSSAWAEAHLFLVRRLHLVLELAGPACGALAVLGLVRARLEDRRWRAVYILCLAGAALCAGVLAPMRSMSLDHSGASAWWLGYLWRYLAITAAGLLGAGVGLC